MKRGIKVIRNKLASILADRGIKISRAAMELPNISRNTITNTASNNGKMIQLETIDTLCQYLNITPAEFFEYLPFDLEFHTDITKNEAYTDELFDFIKMGPNGINFDFYVNKITYNSKPNTLYEFSGTVEKIGNTEQDQFIYIKLTNEGNNDFKEVWDNPKFSGFKLQVWNDIKQNIALAINKSMVERFPQMQDDPFDYVHADGSDLVISSSFNVDAEYNHTNNDLPF